MKTYINVLWQTCNGSFEWVIHLYPFFWEDHPISLLLYSCFLPGGFNHFQFLSLQGYFMHNLHLCPWIKIFRCVSNALYLFQQCIRNLKWFFSTSGLEVDPFHCWPSSWRSVATWHFSMAHLSAMAIVIGLPVFDQWDGRRAEMAKGSNRGGFNLSPLLFESMLCKMTLLNACIFLCPSDKQHQPQRRQLDLCVSMLAAATQTKTWHHHHPDQHHRDHHHHQQQQHYLSLLFIINNILHNNFLVFVTSDVDSLRLGSKAVSLKMLGVGFLPWQLVVLGYCLLGLYRDAGAECRHGSRWHGLWPKFEEFCCDLRPGSWGGAGWVT